MLRSSCSQHSRVAKVWIDHLLDRIAEPFVKAIIFVAEGVVERFGRAAALLLWAVLGVVSAIVLQYLFSLHHEGGPTLDSKISILSKSLYEATGVISEIEKEVQDRQTLLERLRRDAEINKNLAQLSAAQASAITQALHAELESESRSSFWWGVGQNIVFTILGAFFGVIATEVWRRMKAKRVPRS